MRNHQSTQVAEIKAKQRELNKQGAHLEVDGIKGKQTQLALKQQAQHQQRPRHTGHTMG
jgi:hypothetical protein